MSLLAQKYGVPGRVVPGNVRDLTNFRMTDLNNLRTIGSVRPDVIEGMYMHFAENTGMLSELMQYIKGGSYNPSLEQFLNKNKKGVNERMANFSKNFKKLSNIEYAWCSPAPKGWLYRVVQAPNADPGESDIVGRDGRQFTFVVNKQLGDKDDVWMLADGHSFIILTAQPEPLADGNLRVRARLLFQEGGAGKGIVISRYLSRNSEIKKSHNLKPEASEHGSKSRVSFGEWHRGWMSTMRWEWNITGHAAHVQKDKTPMALHYTTYDGKGETYWVETWRYQMMKDAYEAMDNQLFWGLPYIDNEGRFIKDHQGRRYWSGTGLYYQANRRLKREYTRLNDFTIINDMMEGLYYDALEANQDLELLVVGGIKFRQEFDKLMRNEFRASPEVLFFDGLGNYHTSGEMKAKGIMGIKSNFQYYETPVGKFIVSKCPYFDRKSHPTAYTNEGAREQSYRALVINISKMIGGQAPFTQVTLNGRQNVMGKVAGMSEPGPGGILTTTADVQGEHMLTMQGLALHNPNIMGELKLARGRR
jgi:hypothetical protein